ncbi:MAG TPA: hypothetical protein VJ021_02905 [Thermoplasmata archaeon]|nr:hypothetical protein [Thermoplasmata archaeon]
MAPTARVDPSGSNLLLDMVEALSDRQGELDIRLEHLSLHLPMIPESLELNGQITVSLHLRDLSDKEKAARAAKEIRLLEP